MSINTPRMRMFAGPNGSGKSTIKEVIPPALLGVYINPDDIEKSIQNTGYIDFSEFSIKTSLNEIKTHISNSNLLKKNGLSKTATSFNFADNKLNFNSIKVNSYFASAIAEFIREKLINSGISFTFETVMSHDSKIEILKTAQDKGFRTYLYYVATEDPEINIARVDNRVFAGGHNVPEDKITGRYFRSLELLSEAVKHSNRAYIFDNSGHERVWLAELTVSTNELHIELKSDRLTNWFKNYLLDAFDD